MKVTIPVWDLPLRLFHWLLAFSVIAAYITAKLGGALIDWHGRIGIFILGLLVFRVIWGFVGTTYARFASFFPTFSRLSTYAKGRWQGVGHNPLGGLSVLSLLAALGVQVSTGLFANDDIAFEGPLYGFVDKSYSDQLTGWHNTSVNILLALIVLHIVAIVFYRWFKKNNLVLPMVTGKKEIPRVLAESILTKQEKKSLVAFRLILTLLFSSTVVWGVSVGVAQLQKQNQQQQTVQAYSGF